jgi:uncharacterized protein YutE (UPF0331/DUF86 family)
MRDIQYEQALLKHQQKMLRILQDYRQENPTHWTERDSLALQRALQILIESFIGMARYFVQQKYQLSVSQSREAIDELKARGDLSYEQHQALLKIIGFRDILVHDYLDINDFVVQAIVINQQYQIIIDLINNWQRQLNDYT